MDAHASFWQYLSVGDRSLLALGVAGLLALTSWYLYAPSQTWPTQPIGVLVTDGTVKRRPSRSLNWQGIEGEGTIFLKDTIFSPEDTRSVVTFENGAQMELEPGTMVRFSEVQMNQIDVALLRGDVSVTQGTTGASTSIEVTQKPRNAEEAAARAAQERQNVAARTERLRRIVAQRLRQLPEMDAANIPLDMPFPDPTPLFIQLGELKKRTLASLRPPRLQALGEITESTPTRSVSSSLSLYQMKTVAPENKQKVRLRTGCVRLLWTPVPVRKVSYYLEISRDRKFRYVRSYGTRTNEIALRLNDNTLIYYWRVRAVYGSQSVVTPLSRFEVLRPNPDRAKAKAELKTLPTWSVCEQM